MFTEAEHLWAAERNATHGSDAPIAAGWGCVGLVEHPRGPMHREDRERWMNRVRGEPCYGHLPHGRDKVSAISKSGFLSIDWPKTMNGSLLEWDVLLAAATCPTLDNGEYPSARTIAEAWQTPDGQSKVRYFWNNRKHELTTFQDTEIEVLLTGTRAM